MYGFDYSEFMTAESDLTRAKLITGGFLSDPNKEKTREDFLLAILFLAITKTMKPAQICQSMQMEK